MNSELKIEQTIWYKIFYGRRNEAKEIIEANDIEVNFSYEEGLSLLHMAAKERAIEIMEILLTKGADINIRDDIGNTPLMTAVYAYNFKDDDAIKFLLDKGARTDLKNNSGNDFEHFCKVKGYSLEK